MPITSRFPLIPCLFALALGGCALASVPHVREETSDRLASAAWMVDRDIPAGKFTLRGYERMHERYATANVYIDGDSAPAKILGNAPRNPVALHLATKDKADNVVYLARPCQFAAQTDDCTPEIWNDARYSQDVIDSFNAALDEISKRYDISGYNLIGYDGGGAIALLLAAKRADVLTVRTVAGVLDHELQSKLTGRAPLKSSLNPVTHASSLSKMPQMHFIGGQDTVVSPSIVGSYMQASPPSRCVQSMVVQEATHDKGWVDKWPELLAWPVTCYGRASDGFDAYGTGQNAPPSTKYVTIPEKPEKP